jgi:hypothetical protein
MAVFWLIEQLLFLISIGAGVVALTMIAFVIGIALWLLRWWRHNRLDHNS